VTGAFRIAALTDTHVAPTGEPETYWHNRHEFDTALGRVEAAARIARERDADLCVMAGDIAHHGDLESMSQVIERLDQSGIETFIVPGNHDVVGRSGAVRRALAHTRPRGVRLAGPNWTQLDAQIVLAGADLRGKGDDFWTRGPARHMPDTTKLAIWLSHFPVISRMERFDGAGLAYAGDARDCDRVRADLRASGVPTVVISGHLHARDAVVLPDLLEISVAASIEPPFELALVDIIRSDADFVVDVARSDLQESEAVTLPNLVSAHERYAHDAGRGWSVA
jgi:3',5'-cyclic AMP phosphodiesterase CpdA